MQISQSVAFKKKLSVTLAQYHMQGLYCTNIDIDIVFIDVASQETKCN